jgi:catechol 2,3-dioxygenase
VPVRRIDHVNVMVSDVARNRQFLTDVLTFRLREQKIGEGGVEVGAWLSVNAMVHDIAIMRDATGSRGRFHHIAYWYGAQQHLLDIADVFSERDIRIEAGPAKHGVTQGYFLYCFEPGGNRVELFGDTGYLIFDPDWQTVVWNVANEVDLEKSSIWFGGQLPKTFYRYGTPIVPGASLEEIANL